ncbi:hypothetical protein C0989_001798 [Termitomyces sp. Mn162]|nr:hypothetical protein C0989_001798 [Termitomyces sp. Mn162]
MIQDGTWKHQLLPDAAKDFEIWASKHPSIEILGEVMKKDGKEADIEEGASNSGKKDKGKSKDSGKNKDKGKEKEKTHNKQHK